MNQLPKKIILKIIKLDAKGLSQRQIAWRLHISKNTVNRWLNIYKYKDMSEWPPVLLEIFSSMNQSSIFASRPNIHKKNSMNHSKPRSHALDSQNEKIPIQSFQNPILEPPHLLEKKPIQSEIENDNDKPESKIHNDNRYLEKKLQEIRQIHYKAHKKKLEQQRKQRHKEKEEYKKEKVEYEKEQEIRNEKFYAKIRNEMHQIKSDLNKENQQDCEEFQRLISNLGKEKKIEVNHHTDFNQTDESHPQELIKNPKSLTFKQSQSEGNQPSDSSSSSDYVFLGINAVGCMLQMWKEAKRRL